MVGVVAVAPGVAQPVGDRGGLAGGVDAVGGDQRGGRPVAAGDHRLPGAVVEAGGVARRVSLLADRPADRAGDRGQAVAGVVAEAPQMGRTSRELIEQVARGVVQRRGPGVRRPRAPSDPGELRAGVGVGQVLALRRPRGGPPGALDLAQQAARADQRQRLAAVAVAARYAARVGHAVGVAVGVDIGDKLARAVEGAHVAGDKVGERPGAARLCQGPGQPRRRGVGGADLGEAPGGAALVGVGDHAAAQPGQ